MVDRVPQQEMICAVLCTGPSLTQEDVDYCRGKATVIAVSDAYRLAPWADVLVSHDKQWWEAHPEAKAFPGPKFTEHPTDIGDIKSMRRRSGNSGALGLVVAAEMGATKIVLLGCDLQGSHFFGPHTAKGLVNSRPDHFKIMQRQFKQLHKLPVVNCSPCSALQCFPRGVLREVLPEHVSLHAAA